MMVDTSSGFQYLIEWTVTLSRSYPEEYPNTVLDFELQMIKGLKVDQMSYLHEMTSEKVLGMFNWW